jgi:hypothetical protein
MGDSFYSPDPLLVELQNWKGEELPGETGLRSIQIYLPKHARQRSAMSSFILLRHSVTFSERD